MLLEIHPNPTCILSFCIKKDELGSTSQYAHPLQTSGTCTSQNRVWIPLYKRDWVHNLFASWRNGRALHENFQLAYKCAKILTNADIYSAHADWQESMNDSGCIGLGFWFVGLNVEFWQFGAEIIALTQNRLLTKIIRGALWTTDDRRLLLSEPKELVLQSPGEKGKKRKENVKMKKWSKKLNIPWYNPFYSERMINDPLVQLKWSCFTMTCQSVIFLAKCHHLELKRWPPTLALTRTVSWVTLLPSAWLVSPLGFHLYNLLPVLPSAHKKPPNAQTFLLVKKSLRTRTYAQGTTDSVHPHLSWERNFI